MFYNIICDVINVEFYFIQNIVVEFCGDGCRIEKLRKGTMRFVTLFVIL